MAAGRVQMTDLRASTHVTHPVTPALSGRDSRPRRVRLRGPSSVSRLPDRQGRPSPESRGGDSGCHAADSPCQLSSPSGSREATALPQAVLPRVTPCQEAAGHQPSAEHAEARSRVVTAWPCLVSVLPAGRAAVNRKSKREGAGSERAVRSPAAVTRSPPSAALRLADDSRVDSPGRG